MPKYNENDIISGKKIFSNGSIAGYVMIDNKLKWRIVKGGYAPKFYNKKNSKKDFDKWWNNKLNKKGGKNIKKKKGNVSKKSTVSLKTAIKLLRNYYTNKYK